MPISLLATVEDILKIAQGGAVVAPVPSGGDGKVTGRICTTEGQVLAGVRWAADTWGSQGALLKSMDGEYHQVAPEALEALDPVVPTLSRERPLVAFVGKAPSDIDAARGFPLAGMDGDCFKRAYLAPLGLTEAEVMVTNLMPMAGSVTPEVAQRFVGYAKAELNAWEPQLVVALGKAAREELGAAASFTLPHPSVVRRQGDSGELTRKLRKLRQEIERVRKGVVRKVQIAKFQEAADPQALPEKRIVYGVALDPYQLDSQGDYLSAAEIESAAHNWMAGSRIIGFMHESQAQATPVESWLWPYPSPEDYQAAMQGLPHSAYAAQFGDDVVHSGAWVVATRIDDPVLWEQVCSGELDAYSIGGFGVRSEVDSETPWPEVTFVPQGSTGDYFGKASSFDESKHPRSDNGQFGTGSTSSGKGIAGAGHAKYKGAINAKTPKEKAEAVAQSHPEFTPKDHIEAAQAHQQAANRASGDNKEHHEMLATAHAANARKAPAAKPPKPAAEPRRGDKVRAKEVADAHPNYSAKDHLDAARRHDAMAQQSSGAEKVKHQQLSDAHLANAKKPK